MNPTRRSTLKAALAALVAAPFVKATASEQVEATKKRPEPCWVCEVETIGPKPCRLKVNMPRHGTSWVIIPAGQPGTIRIGNRETLMREVVVVPSAMDTEVPFACDPEEIKLIHHRGSK